MLKIITSGRTYMVETAEQVDNVLTRATFGMVANVKRKFVNDTKSMSNVIFKILKEGIRENFARGRAGGLGWPALKRVTYVMRAMKGFPIQKYPVLRRTGALERGFHKSGFSVVKMSKNTVGFTMTNDVPYSGLQNDGGVVAGRIIKLKSTYSSEGRAKHYSVLVDEGERGMGVQRKYKRYGNNEGKKTVFYVPPRRFAFISQNTLRSLEKEVFTKTIQKDLVLEDPLLTARQIDRILMSS